VNTITRTWFYAGASRSSEQRSPADGHAGHASVALTRLAQAKVDQAIDSYLRAMDIDSDKARASTT